MVNASMTLKGIWMENHYVLKEYGKFKSSGPRYDDKHLTSVSQPSLRL